MHSNRSILSKLLLCFMDLSNEVNETLPSFWHSLFWPVGELELADGSRLTILKSTDRQNHYYPSLLHPGQGEEDIPWHP